MKWSEADMKWPCVQMGDIDGDGLPEMAVAYQCRRGSYITVLKWDGFYWRAVGEIQGKGCTILFFGFVENAENQRFDLLVKWRIGLDLYKQQTYSWIDQKIKKISKKTLRQPINLYPASVNTVEGIRWGYINEVGQFNISPQFNQAGDFQKNGLAIVLIDDSWGAIDQTGKFIVEPQYSSFGGYSEGRAVVNDQEGFKVIDENGNILFKSDNFIGEFQDGKAQFTKVDQNGQWLYGYINREGDIIIPAKYLSAADFNNGKAVVQPKDGEYQIIDEQGNILQTFNYAYVGEMREGLLPFKENQDGKFGFIDEVGKVKISPQFSSVSVFQDGRAVVNTSENFLNQYGLIDKKGQFMIPPIYNDIQIIGEQRAAVGTAIDKNQPFIGSKYAVTDLDGNLLTDFNYYDISNYDKGYASVYDNTNTFFIDKKGQTVKNLPSVEGFGWLTIKNNIIQANVDRRTSYLDQSGRVIWKPNTMIPLNSKYTVKEQKYAPNRNYLVYYPEIIGMEDQQGQQVNEKLKDLSNVKPIAQEANLDYSYDGEFSIEFFKDNLLEFNLSAYHYPLGAAHGMPTMIYVPIDLQNGNIYTLSDLFKKEADYVTELSNIVRDQIEKQGEDSYIWMNAYKGISADQPFYVTEDALHLYFSPYEIAPYAAGFPTFTIPFEQIMNLIDTNGAFWRSFH